MNILLFSLVFNPDNVSTAQIMAGLAEDLQQRGHTLTVITTTPHFHPDASLAAAQPLRPWIGRLIQRSELSGIPVYHIWVPNKSVWPPLRVLSWLWFHFFSVVLALCLRFRPRVILACSPPITIGLAARFAAACLRADYIYNVQELYPDIAVNLGYVKNPRLIACLSAVERAVYSKALAVTSITEAMCAKIRTRTDPAKVVFIPNFVELPPPEALPPDVPHADFVITYAGNMGTPQNLGLLIEAAPFLKGVRIRLIGDGGDKARLLALAQRLGVLEKSVFFEPYRPLSDMPAIYAESDLFYVAQMPEACSDGIPSKIYRILGHRKPLLIATAETADLAQFVRRMEGGVVVSDFSAQTLAHTVESLRTDPARLSRMAAQGYANVSRYYARAAVTEQYDALLRARVRL